MPPSRTAPSVSSKCISSIVAVAAARSIVARSECRPPFRVNHRRVRDSLKQMRGLLRVHVERRTARRAAPADVQIQAVELLPHLRADLLADVPRVLARRTTQASIVVFRRTSGAASSIPRSQCRIPSAACRPRPSVAAPCRTTDRASGRGRRHRAAPVLGPLEIAAHPVTRRRHATACVSLRGPRCPCCRRPATS